MDATTYVFKILIGSNVTDAHLKTCAALFSANYGIWAPDAPAPMRPGNRVKMSAAKLRQECLADPVDSLIVTCTAGDVLVGHACVTKWAYKDGCVGWVTQLVVEHEHRRRHIATNMLQTLKQHHPWFDDVIIMGIASSHPAACNSLCNMFGGDTKDVDLRFIATNAADVLGCSPVPYLRDATLQGALAGVPGGSYTANTRFFVDHTEPLDILRTYLERDKWAFGELHDGHEFLVLLPVPRQP
ncbi:hypothetical protein C8Q77DRAFT_814120 [Trametes polyzona]|nr:hypothetical protein C8Q77DRAFT_814120 [Trametes polyzona]